MKNIVSIPHSNKKKISNLISLRHVRVFPIWLVFKQAALAPKYKIQLFSQMDLLTLIKLEIFCS